MFELLNKLIGRSERTKSDAASEVETTVTSTLPTDQYSPEVVDTMAGEMSDQQGTWWASQSARKVESKLSSGEIKAAEAAEAWAKNPSESTSGAVNDALKNVDHKGPGSWAAQAAQWAAAGPAAAAAAGGAGTASLVPQAVAGAVKVAAAMAAGAVPAESTAAGSASDNGAASSARGTTQNSGTQSDNASNAPPTAEEQQKTAEALKPFIDMGKAIAQSSAPWK